MDYNSKTLRAEKLMQILNEAMDHSAVTNNALVIVNNNNNDNCHVQKMEDSQTSEG